MEDNAVILEFQREDGTSAKREILSVFKASNGIEYAALLPLDEGKDVSIELARFVHAGGESYTAEGIDTEEELRIAQKAFEGFDSASAEGEGELLTLSFQNEKGEMRDWSVVDVFDHNNRSYVALIPSDGGAGVGSIEIHLMRLTLTEQNGVEGCEITSIPSDMEYEEVASVFDQRVSGKQ